MKVEDLQIFDWVLCDNMPYQVNGMHYPTGTVCLRVNLNHCKEYDESTDKGIVVIEKIEPLLLKPEHLLMNGWTYCKEDKCYKYDLIRGFIYKDGSRWILHPEGGHADFNFDWVNDLQQILRTVYCLKEEANNFKIEEDTFGKK